MPPAAGSQRAGRWERADAHACDGDDDGDGGHSDSGHGDGVVTPEPPWFFS